MRETFRILLSREWSYLKLLGRNLEDNTKIRPTTAPIGNDLISLCCKTLSEIAKTQGKFDNKSLRTIRFMGKKDCNNINNPRQFNKNN